MLQMIKLLNLIGWKIFRYKHRGYKFRERKWLKTVAQNLTVSKDVDISKIRNVGILAHVDAGKTTTTEKMLHVSGMLTKAGHVDKGDTLFVKVFGAKNEVCETFISYLNGQTTDYLPQERERGITIMTACVTVPWNGFKINILDTPGHVDFAIEVERCLRVMDAAILLLDASAGVEAQTLKLWRALQRFRIPTLCYVNKMDKASADFDACLASITQKLNARALPLQLPRPRASQAFAGVYDLVDAPQFAECQMVEGGRNVLIETLAEQDPFIMDALMKSENYGALPMSLLISSIRSTVWKGTFLPVLCGSSTRGSDNQTTALLDAICTYLPDPTFLPDIKPDSTPLTSSNLDRVGVYAVVFKILNDKQNGLLSFVRVYTGTLKPGQYLNNLGREKKGDKVSDIWSIQGESLIKVQSVKAGNIAVVSGLSSAYTGDCFVSPSIVEFLKTTQKSQQPENPIRMQEEYIQNLCTAHGSYKSLHIPEPIFYCTVEAGRAGAQKDLDRALSIMAHEDPSLRVEKTLEGGSLSNALGRGTLIGGQGQLHIQIVKDRLRTEFNNLQAFLGPLTVKYKEKPVKEAFAEHELSKVNQERKVSVHITLSVNPLPVGQTTAPGPLKLIHTRDNNLAQIAKQTLAAIESGVHSALSNGGTLRASQIVGCDINLHAFHSDAPRSRAAQEATLPTVSACASASALLAIGRAGCQLLEPIATLKIIDVPEGRLSQLITDLTGTAVRGKIENVERLEEGRHELTATAPLSNLADYGDRLSTLTSGSASFVLTLKNYEPVVT